MSSAAAAAPHRRRVVHHANNDDNDNDPHSSLLPASGMGMDDIVDDSGYIIDNTNRRVSSSGQSSKDKAIALILGVLLIIIYQVVNSSSSSSSSPSSWSSSVESSSSSSTTTTALRKGNNNITVAADDVMETAANVNSKHNDHPLPRTHEMAEEPDESLSSSSSSAVQYRQQQQQQQHHPDPEDKRDHLHLGADNVEEDEAEHDHEEEEDDHEDTAASSSFATTNPNIFDKEYDNCIVGSGLSGSVIAENYSNLLSQTSLVIERRHHIGGNCYDYIDDDTGIRVSLFGAHLFHTKHQRVWDYVQRFGEWEPYEHRVLGYVNGKHVPIPVTIDTVNILFDLNITKSEEMDLWLKDEQVQLTDKRTGKPREALNSEEVALTRVGPRLYNLIFKPYTYKQWAKYPAELGPEVLSRIPFRNDFDGRYFSDKYQALPKMGYTSLFEKMLQSPLITVVKNTDYFDIKDQLKCKRLYYTGPIDTYFAGLKWPKLEYRSLSFERVVQKNTPGYFQPAPVVNYPQAEDVDGNPVDYTRIVEYKHLLNQTSKHTIYFIERSTDDGEPYYPVPNDVNKELYKKYQEMAEKEVGVTFVGRLANYKYFNMDDAILNALELFDRDTAGMAKWVYVVLLMEMEGTCVAENENVL